MAATAPWDGLSGFAAGNAADHRAAEYALKISDDVRGSNRPSGSFRAPQRGETILPELGARPGEGRLPLKNWPNGDTLIVTSGQMSSDA